MKKIIDAFEENIFMCHNPSKMRLDLMSLTRPIISAGKCGSVSILICQLVKIISMKVEDFL